MRSALGDAKLTYLGYGDNSIRAGYAEASPSNVRAMLFDGTKDLARDPASQMIDQGRGFQQAFAGVVRRSCGLRLRSRQKPVRDNLQVRVRPLINNPMGVSAGRKLSYTDAAQGVTLGLYPPNFWDPLNRGLREFAQGRGDTSCTLPTSTTNAHRTVPTPP
jgi:hypothetical protein